MKPTLYKIQIRVFISELMDFYKDNPSYGTKDLPYPADSFYQLISPYASFFGPLKNILLIDNNCTYQWIIESTDGRSVEFSGNDGAGMDIEMISQDQTNQKWKKVFKDAPDMDPKTKKLKIKSKTKGENNFDLTSPNQVEPTVKMKYSFLFEFNDDNGITKYASIDPDTVTVPPPPPVRKIKL